MRYLVARSALILGCSIAFCAADARTLSFSELTLREHVIGTIDPVRAAGASNYYFGGVRVRVRIDANGLLRRAVAVDYDNKPARIPAQLQAALKWRFKPFQYRGKRVEAVGILNIPVRPPEVWAKPNAAFPSVDFNDLEITLTRSACFGSCPDYNVTIRGDGTTRFATATPAPHAGLFGTGVLIPGVHAGRIDRRNVDDLVARFKRAHFFGLKRRYVASVTDNPTFVLRFRSGRHEMEVTDYVGEMVGMSAAVTDLERAVDEAADTAAWTVGDGNTVSRLLTEEAAARGAHAPVLERKAQTPKGESVPLGKFLIVHALTHGRQELARDLIGGGWLKRLSRDELNEAFASGGAGCDADIARQLVAAGANPNAQASSRPGSHNFFYGGKTALISALDHYGPCRDLSESARLSLAEALIKLGADVNGVDANGQSALFHREVPAEQALLLKAAANVNLQAIDGQTPVSSAYSDREALPLLERGADPRKSDPYELSLRKLAQKRDMPATLRWLDDHGVE